ncbi:MAG TPA: histidine kinase [Solirubrobacterales bacterium]|nr:histidine kinase [Solirubrobacterales bacterium]
MPKSQAASPPESVALPVRLADDLDAVEKELVEIDLLVSQATAEAARHEGRRAQAAEKVANDSGVEQHEQLLTLTQRAALMQSQVEVLDGKKRVLTRYRDALAAYVEASSHEADVAGDAGPAASELAELSPAVSRLLLGAQEDLRREISRAMHDGPAQSLTNIVLQAQIVERLVASDPASARGEVRELVSMVQQTLDATKSFIFDVRPMVLDDLGLVPTLRRAARDRGRRVGVAVEFDSLGTDRRLPMELESGLFRILDEALTAYLAQHPDRVSLKLDWSERFEARVTASRGVVAPAGSEGGGRKSGAQDAPRKKGEELPPALAAMIEDRRADELDALEAARRESIVALPRGTWRELETRAQMQGIEAELLADGAELRLATDLPATEEPAKE